MVMTLSEARQQVFHYLNDDGTGSTDGTLASLTEVDSALNVALEQAVTAYVARGGRLLDDEVEIAATAGVVDLSAYKPIIIRSVSLKSGTSYFGVSQVRHSDPSATMSTADTVRLVLVSRPSFPTTADGYMSYGADSAMPMAIFNDVVCLMAARKLKIKDMERNPMLDSEIDHNLSILLDMPSTPHVYDMAPSLNAVGDHTQYYRGFGYSYGYTYTPFSLQLVYT